MPCACGAVDRIIVIIDNARNQNCKKCKLYLWNKYGENKDLPHTVVHPCTPVVEVGQEQFEEIVRHLYKITIMM